MLFVRVNERGTHPTRRNLELARLRNNVKGRFKSVPRAKLLKLNYLASNYNITLVNIYRNENIGGGNSFGDDEISDFSVLRELLISSFTKKSYLYPRYSSIER